MPNPSPKKAFTLIEMLVVLAIIVLLSALIVPAVSSVRKKAADAAGLNNLRQLGLAYIGVVQENKGIMPSWNNLEGDNIDRWDREVNVYLGGDASMNMDRLASAFQDPGALARGLVSKDNIYHFALLGGITRGGSSRLGPYRRIFSYNRPQQQIIFADSGVDGNLEQFGDLTRVDGGFQSWEGFSNGNLTTDGSEPIAPGNGEKGNIRWFKGEAKFFFLDGHVQKLVQEDVLKKNVNPLYR